MTLCYIATTMRRIQTEKEALIQTPEEEEFGRWDVPGADEACDGH
jgi:hypothetical protein